MGRNWIKNLYSTAPAAIKTMETGTATGYKVVAVLGAFNDWAAYRGKLEWDDEKVCTDGDKLSKSQATTMFPSFANSGRHYRE